MADLVFVFYSNCFCRLLTEILKLRILSFFAKHFKLYCQLIERKPEKREGTASPVAGSFKLSELAKHFKLCGQLPERK